MIPSTSTWQHSVRLTKSMYAYPYLIQSKSSNGVTDDLDSYPRKPVMILPEALFKPGTQLVAI